MVKWWASSPPSTTRRARASLPAWPSPCRSKMRPAPWETIRSSRPKTAPSPTSKTWGSGMTDSTNSGLESLLYEVKKIVVGQDYFLERVLIALLAGGHLLVEG